ncbi:MAG: 50S ribosomal protein L2 [DPANN group archaeon]|nr:50S ribosomal protein L2P [uncultured archaeon]MBS3065360.1 50S ribosomal protein L2 [DPANN group archaeon]
MTKRLIQQARGKGSLRYQAPSFNYAGRITYPKQTEQTLRGEVLDIINSVGHYAPLAIIRYEDDQEVLLPAALGLRKGDAVLAGENTEVKHGNIMKLGNVPFGSPVFNIELIPENGPKFVRASGAAFVITREGDKIVLKMPSKKLVKFSENCRATVGVVAGGGRVDKPFVKGGKKHIARRRRGKLHPTVSGVAQNAVDHKFGGTHRRTKGRPSTTARGAPPGRKVGLIAARKTGRGGKRK